MIIETKRLLLRPIKHEDIEQICIHFTPDVAKYTTVSHNSERSEIENAVGRYIQQGIDGTDLVYVITQKDTGEFIGVIGLDGIKTSIPEAWIWTSSTVFGNGYGRESTLGLILYAQRLGYEKLYFPLDKRNAPSKKVVIASYGGQLEGSREITTKDGRQIFCEDYYADLSKLIIEDVEIYME